jgi:hypothetical protein
MYAFHPEHSALLCVMEASNILLSIEATVSKSQRQTVITVIVGLELSQNFIPRFVFHFDECVCVCVCVCARACVCARMRVYCWTALFLFKERSSPVVCRLPGYSLRAVSRQYPSPWNQNKGKQIAWAEKKLNYLGLVTKPTIWWNLSLGLLYPFDRRNHEVSCETEAKLTL